MKRVIVIALLSIFVIFGFFSCKQSDSFVAIRSSQYRFDAENVIKTPLLQLPTNGQTMDLGNLKLQYSVLYNAPLDSSDFLEGIYRVSDNTFVVQGRDLDDGKATVTLNTQRLQKTVSSLLSYFDPTYIISAETMDLDYCGTCNFSSYSKNSSATILDDELVLLPPSGEINLAGFGASHSNIVTEGVWKNVYCGHQVDSSRYSSSNFRDMVLAYEDDYVQYYVQSSYYYSDSKNLILENITALNSAFTKIGDSTQVNVGYTGMTRQFCEPTDFDGNNGKIIFVFHDVFPNGSNVAGYFFSLDLYDIERELPSYKNRYYSNQGEILYIPVSTVAAKKLNITSDAFNANLSVLFHEFQHLLFNGYRKETGRTNVNDGMHTWIQEGLSMAAEAIMGNGKARKFNTFVQTFLRQYNGSLLAWNSGSSDRIIASYGHSYLFVRYLTIRNPYFIKQIYNSDYADVRDIETIMGESFSNLYEEFVAMILLTGTGLTSDPKYNVKEFNGTSATTDYKKNGFNMQTALSGITNYTKLDNGSKTFELQPYSMAITSYPNSGEVFNISSQSSSVKGLGLIVEQETGTQVNKDYF